MAAKSGFRTDCFEVREPAVVWITLFWGPIKKSPKDSDLVTQLIQGHQNLNILYENNTKNINKQFKHLNIAGKIIKNYFKKNQIKFSRNQGFTPDNRLEEIVFQNDLLLFNHYSEFDISSSRECSYEPVPTGLNDLSKPTRRTTWISCS